jgi:hypothetical protein
VEGVSNGGLDIIGGELVDEGHGFSLQDFNLGRLGVASLVAVVSKGDLKVERDSILGKVVGLSCL